MKHLLRIMGVMLAAVITACSTDSHPPLPAPTTAKTATPLERCPSKNSGEPSVKSPSLSEIATLGPDIGSIAFSPLSTESGTLLAAATTGAVELWDVTPLTATQRITLSYTTLSELMPRTHLGWESQRGEVLVAFSPDGAVLAIGGTPNTCVSNVTPCTRGVVYRWVIQGGQLLAPLEAKPMYSYGIPIQLRFGSDGKGLALLYNLNNSSILRSEDHVARWDIQSGKASVKSVIGAGGNFLDIAFSPDGASLAISSWRYPCEGLNSNACSSREVVVETALNDRTVISYTLPYAGYLNYDAKLAFSPDGNSLVTAIRSLYAVDKAEDTFVYIHDLQTFQERAQYRLKDAFMRSIALSPDGKVLLMGDEAGQLHFLELEKGCEAKPFNAHLSAIDVLALSPDGRLLAAADKDGRARIWQLTFK